MMVAVCNQKSIAAVYHYYGQDVLMVCEWVLKRKALHDKSHIRWDISSTMWGAQESWAHSQQAPASSVFLLRVEFESSSSKKSEYRVE